MPKRPEPRDVVRCSFCGRAERFPGECVTGASVRICPDCIDEAVSILEDREETLVTENSSDLPKPKEIMSHLNEHVIGQDDAKKALSVAVYNHYKRVAMEHLYGSDVEVQKSNVLLIGPTGVGKTHLVQTLAKFLHVPIAIADATSLTEAGYVGEDVENILLKLIHAAEFDLEQAERGIIYIDEIDKISRRSDNPSITRDVSGEGVQQALLKIIEGTVASVPPQGGRKHPHQDFIQLDTSKILFICGGAFSGLEKVIEQRMNKKVIGFGAEVKTKVEKREDEVFKHVQPMDLHKYGLIPELIGRLPVIVTLDSLNEDALLDILTKPKNSLTKQYQYLLEFDNVYLDFEEDALRAVAQKALVRETGARGLRSILENLLTDVMFDVPSDETVERIIITKETVENGESPIIVTNEAREPIYRKPKPRRKPRRRQAAGDGLFPY